MVHDCNTREKKQELAKMNRDSQMKEMENNILSTNSLKDEILNLKEIVIKTSKMRMKNFDKKMCATWETLCKVSKSCFMVELYFHCSVHFDCVPIYIFDFLLFSVKFTSQLFSSTVESLKDETRLLLLWDGSLVTLNLLRSSMYHLWESTKSVTDLSF